MDAAATPLPREETTPPVTKMYFGPVRKALDFLQWNRRTTHYVRKGRACQIRDFFARFLVIFRQKSAAADCLPRWPLGASARHHVKCEPRMTWTRAIALAPAHDLRQATDDVTNPMLNHLSADYYAARATLVSHESVFGWGCRGTLRRSRRGLEQAANRYMLRAQVGCARCQESRVTVLRSRCLPPAAAHLAA